MGELAIIAGALLAVAGELRRPIDTPFTPAMAFVHGLVARETTTLTVLTEAGAARPPLSRAGAWRSGGRFSLRR